MAAHPTCRSSTEASPIRSILLCSTRRTRRCRPNRADINRHLYALFPPDFAKDHPDAQIEIAYASPKTDDDGPDASENFSVFELQKAAAFAEKKSKAGFNVYVGAALRNAKSTGRASKPDVETGSKAWADFDDAGDDVRVSNLLREKNILPSEIVQTGGTPHRRFQIYVKLSGNVTPRATGGRQQRR